MKHIGNLQYAEGAKKKRKRIGRGQGSGHGGTSTRGHNGQKSRSGARIPAAFEGGQMPLNRRVPKFGFHNRFRTVYQIVNLSTLQRLIDEKKIEDGKVDLDALLQLKVIKNLRSPVKILGNGELTAEIEIEAHKFSETARQKIESAGGKVTIHG